MFGNKKKNGKGLHFRTGPSSRQLRPCVRLTPRGLEETAHQQMWRTCLHAAVKREIVVQYLSLRAKPEVDSTLV